MYIQAPGKPSVIKLEGPPKDHLQNAKRIITANIYWVFLPGRHYSEYFTRLKYLLEVYYYYPPL